MRHLLFKQAESHFDDRRVTDALTLFHEAERHQSDADLCAAGRWQCHMLLGDFERAWQESDTIHSRGKPDPHRFWDGRPLDGKRIIVRCLHGLGDTIQFIRYVPALRRLARSVAIEPQPSLKSLLAQADLAEAVITWREIEPAWDQQIEVMELPRIFRSTLDTLPRQAPYIEVSGSPNGFALHTLSTMRVGVVWKSSAFNPARSIPIEQFARIFSIPGVSFFALQPGPEHDELCRCSEQIVDLHGCLTTVLDTAKIVKHLDLVITVDTMMAHLAGALAIPVWTLLPYASDWRWMLNREDSPWYPTMRLFRQNESADWQPVLQRVIAELGAFAAARTRNGNGRVINTAAFPSLMPEQ